MEPGNTKNILTTKEKTVGLFYTIILFLTVAGACSYLLFFSNRDLDASSGKYLALEQMERIRSFSKFQKERMERIEALNSKVNAIDPGLRASYEKNEVRFMLGQFQEDYEKNKYDQRYRIFSLISKFYEYRMFDKERVSAATKNTELFQRNLEVCQGCIDELANP